MKKIFDFGIIEYRGKKTKCTCEINLKENKKGLPVFTASTQIGDCGGQCLEELGQALPNNKIVAKILPLWRKYHLNDIHPECEHQRALNWTKQASEQIILYTYTLTIEAIGKQNKIERTILQAAKNGKTYQVTPQEQKILNLNYSYTTPNKKLPEDLKDFYKFKEEKRQAKGWTKPEEHPAGILCKPCPVCGYKYGTDWQYMEILPEDLQKIKELLQEGENEQ